VTASLTGVNAKVNRHLRARFSTLSEGSSWGLTINGTIMEGFP
jgi:hypothetical protein